MSLFRDAERIDPAHEPGGSGLPEREAQQLHSLALTIAAELRPATVLHVGCEEGSLVGFLRQAGIDAYGIDASEQAIAAIPAELERFCSVRSPSDPMPQDYDLIICLDALNGLTPEQLEQAVCLLCRHSDDILFSPPSHAPTPERPGEGVSGYWTELFARDGFFRDLDFDASFAGPQSVRFRRAIDPARAVAAYERRLVLLERETEARRELNISQRDDLLAREHSIRVLKLRARDLETRWAELESSPGWAVLQRLQILRARLTPPGSWREQLLEEVFRAFRVHKGRAPLYFVRRVGQAMLWRFNAFLSKVRVMAGTTLHDLTIQVDEIETHPPIETHRAPVEIVVCVHNALADVTRCLESVVHHTAAPYSIILVDDASAVETRDYLVEFASTHAATLLRNEEPRRYTRAANQGLVHSSAEYVVLLNSDTIVTPEWLDRMVACMESDPGIGIAGPLSNTASWQSIPQVESDGDWASNSLPPTMTASDMARLVAHYSARIYPPMPFLNGFCLLLRRDLMEEIGIFDEDSFGQGYGEENDYALRARKAGWQLALADDAYVYHAQSRSYSSSTRKQLSERAGKVLAQKHGLQIIEEGVAACANSRVLQGIRVRSQTMLDRHAWIERGRARYAGLRVLFALPIAAPGGGGNVVIDEALAMREMGVDAQIFNLKIHQSKFQASYPALEIPVTFGDETSLTEIALEYDAVIATHNATVQWLSGIPVERRVPRRGYYVQEFEPYMYPEGSEGYQEAWNSYTLIDDLIRFTKTEWSRREVRNNAGANSTVVGASVNTDIFRPRPRMDVDWPNRPLKIAAMIRPCSVYRASKLTMELLRQASERYRQDVEFVLFGTTLDDPGFAALPRNFPWKLAGVLNQKQVARLMNEVDIFVDFSSHQAMGLTAMEAMACGVAVIVPQRGGADCFARHEENSLIVDTLSREACWQTLQRLIEDDTLRAKLQRNALVDACDYYPERPAFNILSALFD